MNGSECPSWRFEVGICYQLICLVIGLKLLILGSSKFAVILRFFAYENFWDSMSEGVKQCHKELVDAHESDSKAF
jgi:hypothetical protein